MNEATAKALSAERSAAHLTIKELAEKSEVPERTLIRLLKGERNINVIQIAQLAPVFGIYPHEIIESAERFIERAERGPIPAPTDSADEQLADDIASNPGLYDLAANHDENKELEAETPRD